jgi:hypothetical protein
VVETSDRERHVVALARVLVDRELYKLHPIAKDRRAARTSRERGWAASTRQAWPGDAA